MKDIISELYNGNIQPYAKQIVRNSKYDKAVALVYENEQKLGKLLDDSSFALVEQMQDAQSDISAILSKEHFIEGFKIGMQFLFSALSDDKTGDLKAITESLEK